MRRITRALVLLALLLLMGARAAMRWRPRDPASNPFWLPPFLLGVLIWAIYAIVNTEERYVTVAFFLIMLPVFAALNAKPDIRGTRRFALQAAVPSLALLLALLAAGESLRLVLEDRRDLSVAGIPGGWYSPRMEHAAEGLAALGVRPGDAVACIGWRACLDDEYWARLAGVRMLTEVYIPDTPAYTALANLPNRDQVISTVRAQGPKVLVADFRDARVSDADPFFRQWRQLGGTTFYALPLGPP